MGNITITTAGSFGDSRVVVSAIMNGHADAVAQAIEYLAKEVLPNATAKDHELHGQGVTPEEGFRRLSC